MPDQPRLPDLKAYQTEGADQLESGSPLVAYDILAEGLTQFPGNVRLRQLLALSLARTGASRPASDILEALVREGQADEETLGLLARTHKDLGANSVGAENRQRHLLLAYRYYLDAYRISNGIWSGINASTMALLLGHHDEATELARGVRERCLDLLNSNGGDDRYWLLATLGEAGLILREWSEAEDRYSQAVSIAGSRLGDLASTRRNARLILQRLEVDLVGIEACFPIPRVAVLVGHLTDRPGRMPPRFPPTLEGPVRAAIGERIRRLNVGFGYASAACGSDILFHEALLEMKAEVHVVLPYDRDQFQRDSVDVASGADWGRRYRHVLESAKEVITASDQRMAEGGTSYAYGFLLLDGTAALRADELDTELVSLGVWDGKPGDGPGGTETAVARWREAGRKVEIIDLGAIAGGQSQEFVQPPGVRVLTPSVRRPESATGFEPEIVSLLFADAKGFSRLTDHEIPLFVEHFLGSVAAEIDSSPVEPILTNTWGDGLYMVFPTVRDAGLFALALCDRLERIDWASRGFNKPLSLRIGLHAGPAYACIDPVTGRLNYLGGHVSRAARIEPITPPGHVYASGAFAALARAERICEFVCAYVGQMPFAKGYGTFPTYHVYPAGARQRNE